MLLSRYVSQNLQKTVIHKRLCSDIPMFSRVTGLTIAFIALTAVVSASTLVTYNMLKSEETESFFAKVDFVEGIKLLPHHRNR